LEGKLTTSIIGIGTEKESLAIELYIQQMIKGYSGRLFERIGRGQRNCVR